MVDESYGDDEEKPYLIGLCNYNLASKQNKSNNVELDYLGNWVRLSANPTGIKCIL